MTTPTPAVLRAAEAIEYKGYLPPAHHAGQARAIQVAAIIDAALADERAAVERLVRAAMQALETFDHLKLTHEHTCNGVHADNGMCEGESLYIRMRDELADALAPFAAKAGGHR